MEHLDIHFLNVGHGDCTFVDFPSGHLTVIDINNSKSLPNDDEVALAFEKGLTLSQFRNAGLNKESWEDYYRSLLVDPAQFYKDNFSSKDIFRYIQTHPDMDHMSGLCRMFWQDDVTVHNFWDTTHTKMFNEEEFDKGRYNWDDWLTYSLMRDGKVQENDRHKVILNVKGDTGDHWTSDGITVLSPTAELVDYCNKQEDWNNSSYVLRIDYAGRRVVLAGDAEKPAWDSVEAHHEDSELKCDVLKAAHHGRNSGYSESAVTAMDPSLVICSVGKKRLSCSIRGCPDPPLTRATPVSAYVF